MKLWITNYWRLCEKCCHSCESRIILDRREKIAWKKILVIKRLRVILNQVQDAMTKTCQKIIYNCLKITLWYSHFFCTFAPLFY